MLIGEITIEVPANKAGEEGIDVRFTYDVNGALEVEVTALTTKETRSAVFRNNAGLSEAELKCASRRWPKSSSTRAISSRTGS